MGGITSDVVRGMSVTQLIRVGHIATHTHCPISNKKGAVMILLCLNRCFNSFKRSLFLP